MRREQRCRFHSSGRAASRSWTEAAVITTASSRPSASTAMCRFLPFTFFALSQPRLARGTVSAARTDWESITAAVGPGSRPAAARTRARSASCSRGQGAVVAPGGEVPVHRGPGREAVRQVPPGAPGPVQVQDRLDDLAQRPDPGPAAPARNVRRQVRGDDLPLGIGQVTGIAPGLLSGPAHTLGTRGPCCLFGLHTSRNTGPAPAHLSTPATALTQHKPATTGTSGHLSNTHLGV